MTQLDSTSPLIIVADNSADWLTLTAAFVNEVAPSGAEVRTTTSPDEVISLALQNKDRLSALVLDWHFGNGEKDFPQIVEAIVAQRSDTRLPCVAISGTHANLITGKLLKSGVQIPFIDKSRLALGIPSERGLTSEQSILQTVLKGSSTEFNQETLELFRSVASYAARISDISEAVDEIKGKCALILEKLKTLLTGDLRISLSDTISFPFREDISNLSALHEFKNDLLLSLNNLTRTMADEPEPTSPLERFRREVDNQINQRALEEIYGLWEFVRDRYEQLLNPVLVTDVAQVVLQALDAKLSPFKERLIVERDTNTLMVNGVSQQDIEIILTNLVQNALLHGSGNHPITIGLQENNFYVSNSLVNDGPLPFEISENRIVSEGKTIVSEFGSGTGLAQVLKIAENSLGIISVTGNHLSEFGGDYKTSGTSQQFKIVITFDESSLLNPSEEKTNLYSEQEEPAAHNIRTIRDPNLLATPIAFSKVAIIDHDSASKAKNNLGMLWNALPEGMQYCLLDQQQISESWFIDYPVYPDEQVTIGDMTYQGDSGLIEALLQQNHQQLSESGVCLIHGSASAVVRFNQAIKAQFPHMVIIPLSSFPGDSFFGAHLSDADYTQICESGFGDLKEDLLTYSSEEDAALITKHCEDPWDIFSRRQSPDVFAAIIRSAMRKASAHSGNSSQSDF